MLKGRIGKGLVYKHSAFRLLLHDELLKEEDIQDSCAFPLGLYS
jgi:hypothetical protein